MGTLNALQSNIGYQFKNISLLKEALVHSGVSQTSNNERLEFVGDGILGALIGHYLYLQHPHYDEGKLSRFRASLVNKDCLSDIAQAIALDSFMLFHVSFDVHSISKRVRAGAMEAVLGAVFLDSDYSCTYNVVVHLFEKHVAFFKSHKALEKDSKTQLQEYCQSSDLPLPEYEVLEHIGPDNDRLFVVSCVVADAACTAEARSVRIGQQKAAKMVLKKLMERLS